jgi:hypothetical protein
MDPDPDRQALSGSGKMMPNAPDPDPTHCLVRGFLDHILTWSKLTMSKTQIKGTVLILAFFCWVGRF